MYKMIYMYRFLYIALWTARENRRHHSLAPNLGRLQAERSLKNTNMIIGG